MKPSKGIVKELEKERDGWKAQHDDLMDKYNKEREINKEWAEIYKNECGKITRLEEELESYHINDNPQMCSTLNKRINELHAEIRELHKCLRDADKEKEDAMKYAQDLKDDLQEHMKKYKTDIEAYEETFSHMKEKHDRLLDYVRVSG